MVKLPIFAMTTTFRDFEEGLRQFAAIGSGLKTSYVIPGNTRSARPDAPYATLLLITDTGLDYPVRLQDPDLPVTISTSHRRAIYSLQFYRKGALDHARNFCVYAESEIGLTVAEDFGFYVVQVPRLSFDRLDSIVGDAFEERAIINNGTFMLDYELTTEQNTGYVDTFEGTINANGRIVTIKEDP